MSQFFDQASLVMVPSGYKDGKVYSQKPLSTDGELTFTRASSASRIAPNGLIEKVRTNVATYSQNFTNWTQSNVTITTSATANPLDGSLDSQDITPTATLGVHRVLKTNSAGLNSINTWSVYAKAKGYNFLFLVENGNTGANVSFNLSTGEVSQENSAVGQVESLGSGWYRCSMIVTTSTTPRFDIYVSPTDSLSSYTADGTSGVTLFGAQAEVSDFGPTPYIATTTAAVSVGPVANVPRLDYLGSSCPRLILEGQRTNLVTFSESFDNAAWGDAGTTITANQAVSPDGYSNADLAVNAASSNYIFQGISGSISGTFSASIFVKKGTQSSFAFGLVAGGFTGGMGVKFNFDTQTFSTPTNYNNFTSISASYQSYGNGWYRLNLTGTTATSATYYFVLGSLQESFAVNAYVYGAQFEAGAYATSYIPTLGAAVTRGADAASKTGISSLIGQTEGTIFFEGAQILPQTCVAIQLSDTTNANRVQIEIGSNTSPLCVVSSGGSTQAVIIGSPYTLGQNRKIAVTYKNNEFKLYQNGVLVGSDTSGSVPITLTAAYVGSESGTPYVGFNVKQLLVFPTALSAADLAALTA